MVSGFFFTPTIKKRATQKNPKDFLFCSGENPDGHIRNSWKIIPRHRIFQLETNFQLFAPQIGPGEGGYPPGGYHTSIGPPFWGGSELERCVHERIPGARVFTRFHAFRTYVLKSYFLRK